MRDTSGNRFLTRFVQPVEAATADAGPVRIEQSGSVQTKQKQIKILQPYADGLKLHLDIMNKVPAPRVLAILKEMRGQAAFKSAIAEARLNKISLLQNLVSLFPNMFNTEKRNGTFYVSSIKSPNVQTSSIQSAPATQRVTIDAQGRLVLV